MVVKGLKTYQNPIKSAYVRIILWRERIANFFLIQNGWSHTTDIEVGFLTHIRYVRCHTITVD